MEPSPTFDITVLDKSYNNMLIEDERERLEAKRTIISTVVKHLIKIFGGVGVPKITEAREIMTELQFVYPAMFKDESVKGYGLGGDKGPDGLALQMLDIFRNRVGGNRSKKSLETDGEKPDKKKGKRKYRYGMKYCYLEDLD